MTTSVLFACSNGGLDLEGGWWGGECSSSNDYVSSSVPQDGDVALTFGAEDDNNWTGSGTYTWIARSEVGNQTEAVTLNTNIDASYDSETQSFTTNLVLSFDISCDTVTEPLSSQCAQDTGDVVWELNWSEDDPDVIEDVTSIGGGAALRCSTLYRE